MRGLKVMTLGLLVALFVGCGDDDGSNKPPTDDGDGVMERFDPAAGLSADFYALPYPSATR